MQGDAQKNKILSKHTVIEISAIKKVGSDKPEQIPTACPKHPGKELDTYCLDHNALCCMMCVTLAHRACPNLNLLDDVANGPMVDRGLVESELNKVKQETKIIVDEDNLSLIALDSEHQTMTNRMTAIIKKAKNKLDFLHGRFQSSLDDTYNRNKESLSYRLRINKEFQANVDNTSQLLALMNQCGSDRQKFIVEEQSKLQIARHFCRMLQKTKYRRNIFNMTLNFDDTIEKAMNSITTLGVVEVSPSLSLPSLDALTSIERLIGTLKTIPLESSFADGTASDVIDETEQVLPSHETQRVDLWNVSLSPVKSVLCNSRGGSNQIWLTGGVFINGEALLITDYYENRILLFDDHYDDVRQFGVVGKPSHISHGFTADEVLISLCSSRTILRCTLKGGVFTLNSRISTQFRTWGTSVLGDNILAGSTDAVQIILTDGTLVKSLNTSGGIAYVTVSPRGYFYHTDDNAIVCRSHHGKEKFRQNCQGLRGPCGIDVDQDSNVYVCGGLSGNFHLVSADETKERELLPDLSGIRRPCAVIGPSHKTGVYCDVIYGERGVHSLQVLC